MKWTEFALDSVTGCRMFRSGAFMALVAGPGTQEYKVTGRYHLSISHPHRYPKWDEICSARYDLLPDELQMAMFLPPKSEYVNIHNNCFHLHEVKE